MEKLYIVLVTFVLYLNPVISSSDPPFIRTRFEIGPFPDTDYFDLLAVIANFELTGVNTQIDNFTVRYSLGDRYRYPYLGCDTLGTNIDLEGNVECVIQYWDFVKNFDRPLTYQIFLQSRRLMNPDFCRKHIEFKRCLYSDGPVSDDVQLVSTNPANIVFDGERNLMPWAVPVMEKSPSLVIDLDAIYEIFGIELFVETIALEFRVSLIGGIKRNSVKLFDLIESREVALVRPNGACNEEENCVAATINNKRLVAQWLDAASTNGTQAYQAEHVKLEFEPVKQFGQYSVKYHVIRGARLLGRKVAAKRLNFVASRLI